MRRLGPRRDRFNERREDLGCTFEAQTCVCSGDYCGLVGLAGSGVSCNPLCFGLFANVDY